jgi:hypothetical protein
VSNSQEQQNTKQRFMVALTFDVPAGQQQAMAPLIPQERAHIRELAAQGRVESITSARIAPTSGWSCAATPTTTSRES